MVKRGHVHSVGRNGWRALAAGVLAVCVAAYGLWAAGAQERALAEVQSWVSSDERGLLLKDGTFEGSARGFGGMLTVAATVENGYLCDIAVTDTSDDKPYIERASENMPVRIALAQAFSVDEVDTVAGATVSSRGILNATNNALVDAGAIAGEKAGPAANSRTGAKSTAELKQMAAVRKVDQAKAPWELSWFDVYGEEEYYGRHDSSANVSGGFAGGV